MWLKSTSCPCGRRFARRRFLFSPIKWCCRLPVGNMIKLSYTPILITKTTISFTLIEVQARHKQDWTSHCENSKDKINRRYIFTKAEHGAITNTCNSIYLNYSRPLCISLTIWYFWSHTVMHACLELMREEHGSPHLFVFSVTNNFPSILDNMINEIWFLWLQFQHTESNWACHLPSDTLMTGSLLESNSTPTVQSSSRNICMQPPMWMGHPCSLFLSEKVSLYHIPDGWCVSLYPKRLGTLLHTSWQ